MTLAEMVLHQEPLSPIRWNTLSYCVLPRSPPIGPQRQAIAADGSLSKRRVWANLGGGIPDGLWLNPENAVWYGDVPNKRCGRVREGGEVLQTIDLDRGWFACMLGGADRTTLFLMAADWRGPQTW